jgi:malonyl-CoA O-methyltransferase
VSAPIPVSAAEGYALWAETWDATPSPIVALEERMLLPWLEGLRPRRAVDIGCGTGRWTLPLNAVGFDASEPMLRCAARKPALAGRVAVADATAIPIADASADLVICALTLGHLLQPAAALREFARILEPGGQLLMTDFHPDALAAGWRHRIRHQGQVYEVEKHFYRLDQLRSDVSGVLTCRDVIESRIGPEERPLFERAGRPELFEAACAWPAVLLSRWQRS